MTIFAEINQETMKKIFLLFATSLVLFAGCSKNEEDLVSDINEVDLVSDIIVINGHTAVKLAGYYWGVENAEDDSYSSLINVGIGNSWGCHFYMQYFEYNQDIIPEEKRYFALNVARKWGSEGDHSWTLPSEKQWKALINDCYWEWTDSYSYLSSSHNGKSGIIVYQAKRDEDKGMFNKENSGYSPADDTHIFLPANGILHIGRESVWDQGEEGYYWSTDSGHYLQFKSSSRSMKSGSKEESISVRPVAE